MQSCTNSSFHMGNTSSLHESRVLCFMLVHVQVVCCFMVSFITTSGSPETFETNTNQNIIQQLCTYTSVQLDSLRNAQSEMFSQWLLPTLSFVRFIYHRSNPNLRVPQGSSISHYNLSISVPKGLTI